MLHVTNTVKDKGALCLKLLLADSALILEGGGSISRTGLRGRACDPQVSFGMPPLVDVPAILVGKLSGTDTARVGADTRVAWVVHHTLVDEEASSQLEQLAAG